MNSKFLFIPLLLLSAYSAALRAQTAAGVGGLTGVVIDPAGATVPQAHVVVSNDALGIHRELMTTGGGVFNAPALVPKSGYAVRVNAPGFATFEQRNITIHVGNNVSIPVKLQVETSRVQVEVQYTAPATEDKIDVSDDITQHQIDNLPINGRRVDSFVLLTPAVTNDGTFGLLSFRGIPGGNNFLTDGNDTTDSFYNENAGRTRIPTQISQDSVQEFQVLSDAYTAEYGHAIGGVVNTVTRSGTNDLHGTAYWFFRNRTLNARDPFSSFNPSEYRHQFGGSLAGPIVKNKLFYFVNTEEQIRQFPLISSIIKPSVINATTDTWVGCAAPATPQQCAAINGVLTRFYGTLPRTADQQTALAKIDWRPDDKNAFSFSGNYQHFNSPNGIQTGASVTNGGAINSNGIDDVNVRYGRAEWTFVPSGNLVNEARFGWFKDRQADSVNNALLDPAYGALSISVNGQAVGAANYLPRVQPSENRYEGADNLSYTLGKHNFKFGVDYLNTEDYVDQMYNGNGSYSFANATSFALDYSGNTTGGKDYTSYTQAFGNRIVDTGIQDLAFYAQDQYRLLPNLTFYYGLRYEHTFIEQPPITNSDYPQTGKIPADNLNLAPRVGFAWNVDNKTVIRSGYGIYFARYPGAMINTFYTANNIYQQTLTVQTSNAAQLPLGPVFPSLLATAPNVKAGLGTVGFAAPDLRTPYSEQADFSVQRAFGANTSVTLSYLWSRAAEMFTMRDLNMGPATGSITYNVLNAAGVQTGTFTTPAYLLANRVDPRYQRILEVDNGGNSYYNALALQVQRRFAHGFQGSLAYTWSHAIDDNLGTAGSNLYFGSGSPTTLFNGDYQGVKGDSSLDQRQRLTINWVYSPTFTHSTSLFARMLVNNWQLSTITTIATGQPLTETLSVTNGLSAAQVKALGLPSNLAYTNSTLNGFGGSTQVPFLGVNTLRLPNTYRVDARLTKVLPITERFKLSLQFEAFNLTNTITYTSLSTRGYTANGLNIMPAVGLGTPTASAGFPDGTNARREQVSVRLDF